MIKMKALRSFGYGKVNEGPVSQGHEFLARDESRAKELEAHGLAYRIEVKLPPKAAPVMAQAVENKAADSGPFDLAGGRIGGAGPAPSSPPAPQRRRRRSSSSADGSAS